MRARADEERTSAPRRWRVLDLMVKTLVMWSYEVIQ